MNNTRFIPPTSSRLLVKRGGQSILRSASIPKPIVIVDSREQTPFPIFANHPNWIGGEQVKALPTADYSVEGMENLLALERKSLGDLLLCMADSRTRFLAVCERLAAFRWKAIIVEASYEDIKSGSCEEFRHSAVHPNSVCGTLDAIEAKHGIPVILTSRDRGLATERAASWLSKHATYHWLETHGLGRVLLDDEGL